MVPSARLRFGRLWKRLGAQGESDAPFAELAAAYGETGRTYHTMVHILDCLDRLDEAEAGPHDRDLVEAAIWFHDVVHDPRRSDNEARSADRAGRVLAAAGVAAETVRKVQALIRLTDHSAPPADPAARLLCDVDLSILGRDEAQFAEYERRIREEYAWVADPAYRAGRARVLSGFLARPRLYQTDLFRDRYEAAARANLGRALARLND